MAWVDLLDDIIKSSEISNLILSNVMSGNPKPYFILPFDQILNIKTFSPNDKKELLNVILGSPLEFINALREKIISFLEENEQYTFLDLYRNTFTIYFEGDILPSFIAPSQISPNMFNRIVRVKGIITEYVPPSFRVAEAYFECNNPQCGNRELIVFKPWDKKKIRLNAPQKCPACGRNTLYIDQETIKYQEVLKFSIQDPTMIIDTTHGGVIKVSCALIGGLVAKAKDEIVPGYVIDLVGVVLPKALKTNQSVIPEILVLGYTIEEQEYTVFDLTEEDIEAIEKMKSIYGEKLPQIIAKSLAPEIYGMLDVKLGLALALVSGNGDNISTRRQNIHVLIIGDPGVGKTDLLASIVKLVKKGALIAGQLSSAAGLVGGVTQTEDGPVVSIGALATYDKGVIAIDEIDKVQNESLDALLQAMEQQYYSIWKIAKIPRINSRVTIIASANPRNEYLAPEADLKNEIPIKNVLLSRFDLIYFVRQSVDSNKDIELAKHLISTFNGGTIAKKSEGVIPYDFLRKFLAYAKSITPTISEEAMLELTQFYVTMRKKSVGFPYTPRQLTSVVRLAIAYAKLSLDDIVTKGHAQKAIELWNTCWGPLITEYDGLINLDVPVLGASISDLELMKYVYTVLSEAKIEGNPTLSIDEIIDRLNEKLSKKGISPDSIKKQDVLNALDRLHIRGDIYKTKEGHYGAA